MEGELLPGNDGLYSLCARGLSSLTDEEIIRTFHSYGEVVRISRSTQYVFLRFKEYDEGKAVLDGMKDHPTIKITMARNKNTGGIPRNGNGGNFPERNNTDGRNDSRQNFADRFDQRNTGRDFSDRNNTDHPKFDNGFKRTQNTMPSLRGSASDDGKDAAPPLKFKENEAVMQDLVPRGKAAKQLIIANLPHSMMQYQVYMLCKSRGALQVDLYKTYSNIKYAHVHVRSDIDIDELTAELNGLMIDERKLVVMSLDKLLAEHSTPERVNTALASGRK